MSALTFALINASKLIGPGDLAHLAPALEHCARECAIEFGKEPPAVITIDVEAELPDSCVPVIYEDSSSDQQMLAVHWYDVVRELPACSVFVDAGSGFNVGRNSACEGGSHEINETVADVTADIWVPHPTRPGVWVAYENCDPTQASYIEHAHGSDWQVSNFVTRAWFDPQYADEAAREAFLASGGRFDRIGQFSQPGEVGPEGYLVLRGPDPNNPDQYVVWYEMAKTPGARLNVHELATHLPEHKQAALRRKMSRTRKRWNKGAAA